MDVIVCPMDDITAQIVRIEEDIYEEVDIAERAERLFELYQKRKSLKRDEHVKTLGELQKELYDTTLLSTRGVISDRIDKYSEQLSNDTFFTIRDFARELSVTTRTLEDAIQYASLDEDLKRLHRQNLIKYSHLVAISQVQNEDIGGTLEAQKYFAFSSILLNLNLEQLKENIQRYLSTQSQIVLPGFECDYAERISAMQRMAVDSLKNASDVLYKTRNVFTSKEAIFDNDMPPEDRYTQLSLLDNLARKKNFVYLCDLMLAVDGIHHTIQENYWPTGASLEASSPSPSSADA
jgi:hypothetical protein